MPINFVCPACYAKLNAPDSSASRKVKCPKPGCGIIILVPAAPLFDVFISYSSKDKAIADAICSTLEIDKVRCWIAPRDVLAGRPYAERLTDALSASRIMVLVLSSHSNNSPHVLREIEQAVENGTPVIPFRIADIRLAKALEYYLKPFQWLDALTPPIARHLGTLTSTVDSLLSEGKPKKKEEAWAEELGGDDDKRDEDKPERKGGFFSRVVRVAIFLFVISVLIYCVYVYYSGSIKKREAEANGILISKTTGMKFGRIPKGTFKIGSPDGPSGEKDRSDDELLHDVTLTKDYFLGVHQVTRGQFRKFVEDTGYKTEGETDETGGDGWDATKKELSKDAIYDWKNPGFDQADDHPVVLVSWNDAVAFCNWMSGKDGLPESYHKVNEQWELVVNPRGYRLPTEAEWERACRGGSEKQTRFYFGDDDEDLAKYANVADAAFRTVTGRDYGIKGADGYGFTSPVGKFKPNAFGLYDMHGNVWVWCNDWYGEFSSENSLDPRGPLTGSRRVFRGGSWINFARLCRSAYRNTLSPDSRNGSLGFRVALVPSGQ